MEKFSVFLIFVITVILALLSFLNINNPFVLYKDNFISYLGLYSLIMFSLSSLFSVPQAVEGLNKDSNKIKKAIIVGLLINLIISIIISICAVLTSSEITEIAIIGWSASLGLPIKIAASLFIFFAMISSYWAISLALSDIVKEQLKLNRTLCWIIATLPSLLVTFITDASFSDFIKITGGAVAVIIAILLLPAYNNSLKNELEHQILKNVGQRKLLIFIIGVFYILMAIGSFI